MLRKNYFIILTAIALLFIGSASVFAQVAPVRGRVELKKADGTTVPAEGAAVDVYRTDAKGKLPSNKTNKRGEFVFAGLPFGQIFMFAISAPGVQPQIFPNIKAGQDGIVLTVYEGDGKRLTEEEARQLLTAPKKATGTTTGTAATTPAPNPEDQAAAKKAKEEYDKQVAEVTAKNEKVKNANEITTKSLQEGNAAFEAKNYDLAITKYTEGINASPEYVGSAPVLLNNRGLAHRMIAIESYNAGVKLTDAAQKTEKLTVAKKNFQDSLDSYNQSYKILKAAPTADISDQNAYNKNKYDALLGITEVYRLMAITRNTDSSKSGEAKTAFQEYMTLETDAAKKAKAQYVLADVLRESGDFENAIPEYRKALELSPDNPDALAGLGLSLFSVGVSNNDKNVMQEGLNFMERFTQVAPATHPLKSSVADAVTYLKTEQKLTPQKTTPAKKRN
jgi:tetratricopeptide (TPR) repeat protein